MIKIITECLNKNLKNRIDIYGLVKIIKGEITS
jgi:hypothetical protein